MNSLLEEVWISTGRVGRMPPEAPRNTLEVVITLAKAMLVVLGCTSKTLGKLNLFDLSRVIMHAVTDKGKKTVASEFGERIDCVQLKGPEILKELHELEKLLTWSTKISSKTRFLGFLSDNGFAKEDVLLRKRTARILKPAFTVIRDKESKCLFVFIRGTRSIKDVLTDAIFASIPFDHKFICRDGKLRKNNTVSGHVHRGMFTAARWIRKHCTTILLDALRENPHLKIRIVGHSLGGGTAALLTYMLREMKQFSSCTCVTFGPAACMTLELAEFGKPFITSIINDNDMVPTLSASSVHDFISEGRSRDVNILTAVESRLPIVKAIAEHAVTRCTEVVKKHKHRTRSLLHWHRRENIDTSSSSKSNNLAEASGSSETNFEYLFTEENLMESISDDDEYSSSSEGSDDENSDEDEDELLDQLGKLNLGTQDNIPNINVKGREAATTKNITEGERRRVYPPGRIMHIVPAHSSENSNSNNNVADEKHVYLYETPRQLYGKLRLSRRMILDHRKKKYLKMLQQLINQLEK